MPLGHLPFEVCGSLQKLHATMSFFNMPRLHCQMQTPCWCRVTAHISHMSVVVSHRPLKKCTAVRSYDNNVSTAVHAQQGAKRQLSVAPTYAMIPKTISGNAGMRQVFVFEKAYARQASAVLWGTELCPEDARTCPTPLGGETCMMKQTLFGPTRLSLFSASSASSQLVSSGSNTWLSAGARVLPCGYLLLTSYLHQDPQ